MQFLGKSFILFGVLLILIGVIVLYFPKIPLIGKLPGDIKLSRDNFSFYFPIVSSLVISGILTIILNLIGFFKK